MREWRARSSSHGAHGVPHGVSRRRRSWASGRQAGDCGLHGGLCETEDRTGARILLRCARTHSAPCRPRLRTRRRRACGASRCRGSSCSTGLGTCGLRQCSARRRSRFRRALGTSTSPWDDLPWDWADASGVPVVIQNLPPGPHRVLVELADANHHVLDHRVVQFWFQTSASGRGQPILLATDCTGPQSSTICAVTWSPREALQKRSCGCSQAAHCPPSADWQHQRLLEQSVTVPSLRARGGHGGHSD